MDLERTAGGEERRQKSERGEDAAERIRVIYVTEDNNTVHVSEC